MSAPFLWLALLLAFLALWGRGGALLFLFVVLPALALLGLLAWVHP